MADPTDSSSREMEAGGDLGLLRSLAHRRRIFLYAVLHALLFALSLFVAFLIQEDSRALVQGKTYWFSTKYIWLLPFFVSVKLIIFWRMKLLRGGWQYSGIRDVVRILSASWIFLGIVFGMLVIFRYLPARFNRQLPPVIGPYFQRYQPGVLVLDFLATVFLACLLRLMVRIWREEFRPVSSDMRRVLIIGAGNAGETVVREIHRMREERYRVVGFVDDDPKKKDLIIHGVPVLGGTDDIPDICDSEDVEEIIIAMPSATQKQLRHVIDLCSGTKLKFQSLPGVGDLIDGRVTVSQIRPVDIDDLLGREAVALDDLAIGRFIRGRRVLITGAGGSIGLEMCRQICRFGPEKLVLLEQAETPLFDAENDLRAAYPDIETEAVICDIFDRDRVFAVWRRHRPDVVIHAAAHKHVPMMEHNPCEAVKNNILGTRNVADASCECDVAEFVMISTDKAVNPSSVMGASKRVAEIYTQCLNGRDGCRTQFKAVRFGNVLGSAGSVIPTFRRQIRAGGPVTVTHPEMTRYFMTIPEASQLVLQAAATGVGGQIFLLDMGEPVKIVDLARSMITLSGFRPGEDIDIVFTGVRPGEKLFEELRTKGEDLEPTVHPKVMVWKQRPTDPAAVDKALADLEARRNSFDRDGIVEALRELVPEYDPLHPPVEPETSSEADRPEAETRPDDPAARRPAEAHANADP